MLERAPIFLVQCLVLLFITLQPPYARAQTSSPTYQAIWVWPNPSDGTPVTDANDRHTLVTNAAASGVTALFVSVYQATPNQAGRYMFNDQNLVDLIQQTHQSGMKLLAEYGSPDWYTYACSDSSFPVQRMVDVQNYNQANPSATFDGVILDVEPSSSTSHSIATPSGTKPLDSSPSGTDLQELLTFYRCIIQKVQPLPVSVAIHAFWDAPVVPPYQPFYASVINLTLDHVIVMGYRNSVGSSDCSQQGIACLDGPAISYWENCPSMTIGGCSHGRSGNVLAGLETGNISDPTGTVTFYNQGQIAVNQAAANVINLFPNGGWGGFAIDAHQSAYLSSGSMHWPTTNPSFSKSKVSKAH